MRLHVKVIYRLLLKNMSRQKMYLLLVDDEVAIYVYTINKQNSLNKQSSKLKLFKKYFHHKYLS